MRALITGITGQDGAYLAQHLLREGYEVFGLMRRSSSDDRLWRLRHLGVEGDVQILMGDVTDPVSIANAVARSKPHEIYNLAAQSFVGTSWQQPILTSNVTGVGAVHMLEAARAFDSRFYQASSSEMFGRELPPQSEGTRFAPRSPYGAAKAFAHLMTRVYRESYGMHASCGILFNHESPLRGEEFVTRRITMAVARIRQNMQRTLKLGNLNAVRDWGHAADYVRAMHYMVRQHSPGDYVIATGRTATVRDFARMAFQYVELNFEDYVQIDESLMRPSEVPELHGDVTLAREVLDWRPKYTLEDMVAEMVDEDMRRARG